MRGCHCIRRAGAEYARRAIKAGLRTKAGQCLGVVSGGQRAVSGIEAAGATHVTNATHLFAGKVTGAIAGATDSFNYTLSNGTGTTTGTVTISLVSPDMTIEVDFVSPPTSANGWNATFLVMPGMTFEVQGASQPGASATWTTITGPNTGNWTSGADGRLIVTDPEAVLAPRRFYRLKWIP
jgi:hypothetical protein